MANRNSIYAVLEAWEQGEPMDLAMARIVEENLDALLESELAQIEAQIDAQPVTALMQMTRLTSFINAALARLPAILRRLQGWVSTMKSTVNALAKKLGANSFSLGVSMPFGLSVDLSFPVI